MIFMAKKSNSGKLTARIPESLSAQARGWSGANGHRHRYTGRKMGIEDMVAWIVYDFMSRTDKERDEILARSGPAVEKLYRDERAIAAEKQEEPGLEFAAGSGANTTGPNSGKPKKKRG